MQTPGELNHVGQGEGGRGDVEGRSLSTAFSLVTSLATAPVARLAPDAPRSAASVFQRCWDQAAGDAAVQPFDVTAPPDLPAEPG